MTISSNLEEFAGKRIVDFRKSGDVADFSAVTPRLRCGYDAPTPREQGLSLREKLARIFTPPSPPPPEDDDRNLRDLLAAMLDEPGVRSTQAIVFGMWMDNGESYEVTPASTIELLVLNKDRLPDLTALFFGDITVEENEMSWIEQSDYSAIWGAFPRLGHFGVRGSNNLSLGAINHPTLHTLVVESGGLPASIVREALAANAPIRHLELWLGDEGYGADTSVDDFKDLLSGALFPNLHTLALRNSEYSDDLATALATAPILDRIKMLDLSMGTLTDRGAQALIGSGRIGQLEKLDISHHYVSKAVVEELRHSTPRLVAADPQQPDDWDGEPHYYVAVSE